MRLLTTYNTTHLQTVFYAMVSGHLPKTLPPESPRKPLKAAPPPEKRTQGRPRIYPQRFKADISKARERLRLSQKPETKQKWQAILDSLLASAYKEMKKGKS